jgi:hypothetical protein
MKRLTKQTWTPEHLARLTQLISEGASAARASVALKRSIGAVQIKANSLGTPFPPVRKVKAERRAREMAEQTLTRLKPRPTLRGKYRESSADFVPRHSRFCLEFDPKEEDA